jgi:hypothetical protein
LFWKFLYGGNFARITTSKSSQWDILEEISSKCLARCFIRYGRFKTKIALIPVGDSHKGPLNNQGKPTYLRKKTNANESKNTCKINPRVHGPPDVGLAILGRNSASIEGHGAALVKLRLA